MIGSLSADETPICRCGAITPEIRIVGAMRPGFAVTVGTCAGDADGAGSAARAPEHPALATTAPIAQSRKTTSA